MKWTAAALAALAGAGCLDAPPGALPTDDAAVPPDADLSPALLARYPFEVEDPLKDSSGNDHHARCNGAECPEIIVGEGEDDFAASFDGSNDLVTLDATGEGPFTVMGWVRMDSDLGGAFVCPINRPVGGTGPNSWQFCLVHTADGQASAHFYTSDEPRELAAPVSMDLGNWYHVAIRWDGSEKTLWWNGDLVAAGDGKTQFDESEIRFGSDIDGEVLVAPYEGLLDDIEIWSGALLQAAIREAAGL